MVVEGRLKIKERQELYGKEVDLRGSEGVVVRVW